MQLQFQNPIIEISSTRCEIFPRFNHDNLVRGEKERAPHTLAFRFLLAWDFNRHADSAIILFLPAAQASRSISRDSPSFTKQVQKSSKFCFRRSIT